MEKKRLLLWAWMLCKRLYKKPAFVFLLILIPAITFAYSSIDASDSGVVTICLACEDTQDPLALSFIDELCDSSQLIRFMVCDSASEAEYAVQIGEADACWIFRDHLEERIEAFAKSWSDRDAFVRVIERRQSLPLLIAREKLGGLIYEKTAKPFYLMYVHDNIPELQEVSDATLLEYYEKINLNGMLFEFSTIYPSDELHQSEKGSFLFTPVRGLLAIVAVLAGLAASMFYIRDDEKGTFSWVPERYRSVLELAYELIAVVNIVLVMELSLYLSSMTVSFGRECIVSLLFIFGTTGFSMLIRLLCRKVTVIGGLLPLLLVAMLAICPVFYDLGELRGFQFLFPPTYFITAAYNTKYLLYSAIYCLIVFLGFFAGKKVIKR